MTSVDAVLAAYDERAAFAGGEARTARPRLLAEAIANAVHVAEVPCGPGHFLRDYAAANCGVTLVDGSPRMLTAAVAAGVHAGIPTHRMRTVSCRVQRLPALPGVDTVIVPNAALNQLTAQTSLPRVLGALRAAMAPGARLLMQVLCRHDNRTVDAASFYDPHQPAGAWQTDRRLDPATCGGAVARRRRVHHEDGDAVRIDFAYQDSAGARLHTASVDLRLLEPHGLGAVLHAAAFQDMRFLPGDGGLSEVLAVANGTSR
ncbi:class I SAM-dependent methyltransferase [Streptomyces sp. NBRC 109706]|uniref:methyltransferase domain-containing protein n=1 Tax=Streptomyces sp. NBRC 109706 TaxID=1550035 RepID=UPI0007852447|nr:class I SAM-dependent methyltransferase [Streptomyces sp. NBRC 109706]